MGISPEQFEVGFEVFRALVHGDAGLAQDLRGSRFRYFHGAPPARPDDDARLEAERRHLEWYLFENLGGAGDVLPVEHLLEPWAARVDGELREHLEAFLQSQTGIFEVTEPEPGKVTWVQDLAGLGEYPLDTGGMASSLQRGDLIVGRIFPVDGALHHVSPGAGFFRSAELLEAIHHDLERIRSERGHAVVRLSQCELERMFWGEAAGPEDSDDAVEALMAFLLAGGVTPGRVHDWLDSLGRIPRDPRRLALDAGTELTAILDAVAFETELDLDRTRQLFLAAWNVLRPEAAPPVVTEPLPGEADVARAIAEFDEERRRGLDVETSFRHLEQRLGLEDDEEEDHPAPDFPGVVGAMVEEFLWELERESGSAERDRHEGLRVFGGYAENITVFENLGPREVLSFAAFWLPESRRLKSGAEAERMARSLEAFASWADSTHGLELMGGQLAGELAGLRSSLPRAVIANALLPRDRDTVGELFEFLGPGDGACARVCDQAGEQREVPMEARLLQLLEEGDLLRGATEADGGFVVCCCYPPEAAGLRQGEA